MATAVACRALGATMICANHRHAQEVKLEHGISTVSIDAECMGLKGPFLADHFALQRITHEYETRIRQLTVKLTRQKNSNSVLESKLDSVTAQRNEYKTMYLELKGE
jgi:hypothetical protein